MYWVLSAVNNLEVKMTSPKDDKEKTRIPYEPPRLFDLGGGAAAGGGGVTCSPGGSPGDKCTDGNLATTDRCTSGGFAGKKDCAAGGVPQKKCKAGSTK